MNVHVLHVVSSLERGGIEMWLIDILRRLKPPDYQMDFLVLQESQGALAPVARQLGSRVVTCPHHRNLWKVWRCFAETLRRNGPYDVVHCHSHHFSGVVVRLASLCRVPVSVVHSHNDTREVEASARFPRRLYLWWMKRWIRRYATWRVGVSRESAEDLFGAGWQEDRNTCVIHCGVDLSRFSADQDGGQVRRSVGLPADALVIGHVGRFYPRKNHRFLLDVAAELFALMPHAWLLSLGDGPLMPEIQARAEALGIADRIVFAGSRSDVPVLMRSAMDVFMLPSHHEGLSIALLEAQAAGLPCVVSDRLTQEGDAVASLVHRLPLDAGPAAWATVALRAAQGSTIDRNEALRTVLASDFNIERSAAKVAEVYAFARKHRCQGDGDGVAAS
jgi:glycosyltransferase involved in cell wall biosynthesis